MPQSKIALVTGGNRGIGFEIVKGLAKAGLEVCLTSRDMEKGRAAAKRLSADGLKVHVFECDVARSESLRALHTDLMKTFGRLDVLINNAGVFLDSQKDPNAISVQTEVLRATMETNVYGPYQLCQMFLPEMKKNNYGRVVNMSSGMGQLSEMNGGCPGYRISKVSLNALTRIFSEEMKHTNVLVNSMCPGWVKTDMGGAQAPRTPEQGADTAIWLATLEDGGPSGLFFRDRERIPW